jgi:nicotinamidase-related amidase
MLVKGRDSNMDKIVVACSLQKAYVRESGTCYLGESIKDFEVKWLDFLKESKAKGYKVFFTREIHDADEGFYRGGKTHSLVGTSDIQIPEVYKPYIDYIINVNRYNAFYGTALGSELYKIKPKEVIIIGVETHTNVLFTAEEFRNRGYDVTVMENLTTSSDEYLHALGITLLSNTLSVTI